MPDDGSSDVATEPLITLSALEHHVYCERQAALIHVDGVWADNRHTVRGTAGHRRADTGQDRRERGRQVLRGLEVWHTELGLSGRCDVVEVAPDGSLAPVEYKMGVRHGRAADVQVCAQGLCLEEMFVTSVDVGYVWYGAPRRRVAVALDRELRELTVATIESLRDNLRAKLLPTAPADVRCRECQLIQHCMPGVVTDDARVEAYVDQLLS